MSTWTQVDVWIKKHGGRKKIFPSRPKDLDNICMLMHEAADARILTGGQREDLRSHADALADFLEVCFSGCGGRR